jgi:glutamine cyclotransferase
MYGHSDVRLVDLESGKVETRTPMDAKWFGEGLVKVGDLLYQITWQGPTGFIYSAKDLKQVNALGGRGWARVRE